MRNPLVAQCYFVRWVTSAILSSLHVSYVKNNVKKSVKKSRTNTVLEKDRLPIRPKHLFHRMPDLVQRRSRACAIENVWNQVLVR